MRLGLGTYSPGSSGTMKKLRSWEIIASLPVSYLQPLSRKMLRPESQLKLLPDFLLLLVPNSLIKIFTNIKWTEFANYTTSCDTEWCITEERLPGSWSCTRRHSLIAELKKTPSLEFFHHLSLSDSLHTCTTSIYPSHGTPGNLKVSLIFGSF